MRVVIGENVQRVPPLPLARCAMFGDWVRFLPRCMQVANRTSRRARLRGSAQDVMPKSVGRRAIDWEASAGQVQRDAGNTGAFAADPDQPSSESRLQESNAMFRSESPKILGA